jgi:hypothetical protein
MDGGRKRLKEIFHGRVELSLSLPSHQRQVDQEKAGAICRKNGIVPIKGMSAPPRAGPIIAEISSCSPPNTDAEGSSSSDTMSVSERQMPAR